MNVEEPNWWEVPLFVGFRIFVGACAALMLTRIPSPWDLIALGIACVGIFVAMIPYLPKRCEICGTKDSIPVPTNVGEMRRPLRWWDLRLPSAKNNQWLCESHLSSYRPLR